MRARNGLLLPCLLAMFCTHAPPQPQPEPVVLFLCERGAAKSLIAATYFDELARQRGLRVRAVAAATEEPYASVPGPVAAALREQGFAVDAFQPRRVGAMDVETATRVVTIDCRPETVPATRITVERWDDVPKVSQDLSGSMRSIREHVEKLIDELSKTTPPRPDR